MGVVLYFLVLLNAILIHAKHPFEEHEVVPDVVDHAPDSILEITYANGVKVENGKPLTPTQVKYMPKLAWKSDAGKYYTLIMTEPDAPSRAEPTFMEFQHWLVVNIPGDDVDGGETLSQFLASGPGKGTGAHRYVFLVFEQPGQLTFDEERLGFSVVNRAGFKTRKFADKYRLKGPVAGNFYLAEYDDYVPELQKMLGI